MNDKPRFKIGENVIIDNQVIGKIVKIIEYEFYFDYLVRPYRNLIKASPLYCDMEKYEGEIE